MDQVRGMASRVQLTAVNDAGPEQYYDLSGMVGEQFTEVLAVRQHGFASVSPPGSHAVMLSINGRRDLVMVLGGEKPAESGHYRPAGGATGSTEMYDSHGSRVAMDSAGAVLTTAEKTVTVQVGGASIVIADSGASITLTVGGSNIVIKDGTIAMTSTSLTHNGVNIGSTHHHQDENSFTGPPS